MVYTLVILGICFPFILPFVRQIVKKYPTTFPYLVWNVFSLSFWKKRDIIFIVLGIGLVFLWIHSLYHLNLTFNLIAPFTAIFLVSLLFISLTDWYKRIIPDFITFPILILGLLLPHFTIFTPLTPFDALLGAVFGYL
ncbi:MAG: prepilin peptidase, partial [Alphaproteobacteria bacterium]